MKKKTEQVDKKGRTEARFQNLVKSIKFIKC